MAIVRLDYSLSCALEATEMDGYVCIFNWDNYHTHLKDHPELEESWFWPDRVKSTLTRPDLIIEERNSKSGARTKVVVEVSNKLQNNKRKKSFIISAWHISNVGKIKELGYTQCKVIYSNGRFCDECPSRFK